MDHAIPADPSEALLGRDQQLAALAAALADARSSVRGVVLVEGEAGMGKTALLRAALQSTGGIVVWASGDEAELDVDHGVVDQLLRAAPLDPAVRRDLMPSSGDDPLATGEALVRLLDGLDLDPGHPLVVVVDDAQWADIASLRALTFAARRLRRDPVLLCVAVRSEGVGHLPESLVRLAGDEGTRLHLGPLSHADVRRMAEQRTGQHVGVAAVDRLLSHTLGNPLYLSTLLDELPDGAITGPGDLPSPRSFSTLVLARLAACPAEVESLVTAVSVLGDSVALSQAAELAQLDQPLPALDEAVESGLVTVTRSRPVAGGLVLVSMSHPLVRAAVLHDLSPGRRATLHRQAGEMVGGLGGLRLRLLGALGPDAELWQQAMAAAEEMAAAGSHGAAAALLRQALVVAPTTAASEQALLEATDEFLLAGRLDDVAPLRPSVDAAAPSARRSYVLGRTSYIVGPRRFAGQHLSDAWAMLTASVPDPCELGPDDRELAGRVAAMAAIVNVDRARGEEAIAWCQRAITLAPERAALVSTRHMLAGAYLLTDRLEEAVPAFDEICTRANALPGSTRAPAVADAFCGRGLVRLWSHDLEGAATDLEVSLDSATVAGSFAARESARFYLAEVRYRQGRWDEAVHLATVSASIIDDGEQEWMAALPHGTVARPLAARGAHEAGQHIARARAAAAAVGAGVGLALTDISALEVAACGRDNTTVVTLGSGLHRAEPRFRLVDERVAQWRATYVEALVAEGDLEGAAEVALELRGASRTPLVDTDCARAAVVIAEAQRDWDALEAAAEEGLALDPVVVGAYPRGRLELVVGRAWRHRGERRRAQLTLEAALARFRTLGAEPWIAQVEREIVASGLRPARRATRTGSELTPQEQAIAQLVASGLTNREVATELVVSAKTIEHHLSRIYSKLGIRSRTQLASVFFSSDT